jgi:hypothetical protein
MGTPPELGEKDKLGQNWDKIDTSKVTLSFSLKR